MNNKKNATTSGSLSDNENSYHDLIEKLYQENYTYFYKIAYSILKNDADAKDAVHDSIVKFYKYVDNISKFKCPEIVPYFVNIVKSVSLNMKKRQRKIFFSEFSEEMIDHVSFSEGADIALEKLMESEKLNSLLGILSPIEREILELKIADKLTFKEIANAVSLSEEATKKRYQRTIKKLREKEEGRFE